MTAALLQQRMESLLAHHRARGTSPTPQEIDDLYTDACAAILELEGDRLKVERRLGALGAHGAEHAATEERDELTRKESDLGREIQTLRTLVRHLRTPVEWVRGEGGPPES